jgi:hypothetical protein
VVTTPPRGFDYKALLRGSLIGVVRSLIERVSEEGFPGDHHFLLTFGTGDPGVVMSARLKKKYPEEMTIVLQHQFWNLGADDLGFQVTLRFGGNPEPLTVPWAALRAFADPSVGFGMRLQATVDPDRESVASERTEEQPGPAADLVESEASEAVPKAAGNVLAFGARRRRDRSQA